MDTGTLTGLASTGVLDMGTDLVAWLWSLATWVLNHLLWLGLAGTAAGLVGSVVIKRLADAASQQRMAVELQPSRRFDPDLEQIFRYGVQLARASGAGPWWVPRRAKAVRIRMRAGGLVPLSYRVEGPASAAKLLQTTPYAPAVECNTVRPGREKRPRHVVRAEFTLRGRPEALLREVPLQPDPLQPLVDAVADLRADLGDTAEICLDIQRAPGWQLRAQRWRVVEDARQKERREARRSARWVRQDAAGVEDSLAYQVARMLSPDDARRRPGRGLVMPPVPRRVDPEKALGKLTAEAHLVKVQLLVRCTSDIQGRAQSRLRQIEASLDVFDGRARLAVKGWAFGPLRLGADRWPWRPRFDHRWQTGQVMGPRSNWIRVEELAGLLKPPTTHCRLPILAGELPSFVVGDPSVVLQGWHRTADGHPRLVATRERETLFETAVGKAGWGKTERALCQAVGLAHAGGGLLFLDPHGDSWRRAAPYLAHDPIMERIARIDLAAGSPNAMLACWNPLGMGHGQPAHDVVTACVDGFASALGWNDISAPRAITIFTKAVQALVTINAAACAQGQPQAQATVFQIRTLLSDPEFRTAVVNKVAAADEEQAAWWQTTFPTVPADGLPVVLNPLDRLAAHPVAHAFLGNPVGAYNLRAAMDHQMVVWVCPAGNGPTDRLLTALIVRDLLRAGLSRRDIPESRRVPFRAYLDELITLDGAASSSIAEILEQLRKYQVRLHGMTQLLQRLSEAVRSSLLQNSSTLTTTAGSVTAIRHITGEWGDQVDPVAVSELKRFHHYATLTVDGKRIGPLPLRGPALEEVFDDLAEPEKVGALNHAANQRAQARPVAQLNQAARDQHKHVLAYLTADRPSLRKTKGERLS
ncbi:ATP/GTP-binding protein [Streptomyces sp. 8N706]|uniref:ATP/GTP-binding protein n=1 Tax=Streptomyces sp. 8N706 TaxID=3457416 RepID=UPI003FD3987C